MRLSARVGLLLASLLLSACSGAISPRPTPSPSKIGPPTPIPETVATSYAIRPDVNVPCTYRKAANGEILPDPACTPGATNPDVTQATIRTTICKAGWSASVRPPVDFTTPLKIQSMRAYGDVNSASGYEYDHLISLELGGAPRDTLNLWPEPQPSATSKDKVENALNKLVCSSQGAMQLAEAQQRIATDWTTAVP